MTATNAPGEAAPTAEPAQVVVSLPTAGTSQGGGQTQAVRRPASASVGAAAQPTAEVVVSAPAEDTGAGAPSLVAISAEAAPAEVTAAYAALPTVTNRWVAEARLVALPFLIPAPASWQATLPGGREDPGEWRRAPSGSPPAALPEELSPGPEEPHPPEAKPQREAVPARAPRALVAGLLTETVASGLSALEGALRDLTEPLVEADRSGPGLLRWIGLSSWLLAGALAYEVARRRAAADPALTQDGHPELLEGPP